MDIEVTKKQLQFIQADADEVLYGGAAGGGKSYGQLIDAFLFAIKHQGSKQLILRNTFPELQRSLVLVSVTIYPTSVASYNQSRYVWQFINGSRIEFGYLESDKDVQKYQSAEYDVIRFDELTHFTEFQYTYMISRIRGANDFPKQIKSSTNPGNRGHAWVKARFIDSMPPETVYTDANGRTRIFIPAKVQDNKFLIDADPDYIKRLDQLPEDQRRALRDGDWDTFEGQYFPEFNREIHVIEPFEIPAHWRRYRALDYGLDMLACYWVAVDGQEKSYVYKELYRDNLIISDAAKAILRVNGNDNIYSTFAPPDLWNRRQETGKSAADLFRENGVPFTRVSNDRVQGWYNLKEWLKPCEDEQGITTAKLVIFKNCTNLIRCLPQLQHDEKDPNDVATEPHEITHAPDAIRYYCAGRPKAGEKPREIDPQSYDAKYRRMVDSITGGEIKINL
jgi:phage terminase large subunit